MIKKAKMLEVCTTEIYCIADVLKQKKVTQCALAQKLGISTNAMCSICKQRAQPLERLFEIADVLGVSVTELINVDYKPNKH